MKRSYGVGIDAPVVPLFSDDEIYRGRVQVSTECLILRKHSDLLAVLTKALLIAHAKDTVLSQLLEWAARDNVTIEGIGAANDISAEQAVYLQSIEPTLLSLPSRDIGELALLIRALVDAKIISMETGDGFTVAGELKRLDYLKSDARKKARSHSKRSK